MVLRVREGKHFSSSFSFSIISTVTQRFPSALLISLRRLVPVSFGHRALAGELAQVFVLVASAFTGLCVFEENPRPSQIPCEVLSPHFLSFSETSRREAGLFYSFREAG